MRPFGPYLAAHFLAGLAVWINRVAVGWAAWDLTQSATWLGIIAFARLGPALVAAPLGGVFADRFFRPTILRSTRSASCLLSLALFILMIGGLGRIEVLVAFVAADGFLDSFGNSSSKALVYDLVPRAVLPSAIPMGSLAFNAAALVGPAAAGTLIATLGTPFAFAGAAACLAAFVVLLSFIAKSMTRQPAGTHAVPVSVSAEIVHGTRYALGHPTIGPLLLLHFAFALTITPLTDLLPGFAAEVLKGDAVTLAVMNATMGGAAILGGLWMASRATSDSLTEVVFVAAFAVCLATFGFVATAELGVALVALVVLGFGRIVRITGTQALIQLAVAKGQRGKIMSLYALVLRLGGAVGAVLIGVLGDAMGLQLAMATAAAAATLFCVSIYSRRRNIVQGIARDEGT